MWSLQYLNFCISLLFRLIFDPKTFNWSIKSLQKKNWTFDEFYSCSKLIKLRINWINNDCPPIRAPLTMCVLLHDCRDRECDRWRCIKHERNANCLKISWKWATENCSAFFTCHQLSNYITLIPFPSMRECDKKLSASSVSLNIHFSFTLSIMTSSHSESCMSNFSYSSSKLDVVS